MSAPLAYTSVPTLFGALHLAWGAAEGGPRVYRILLPNEPPAAEETPPPAAIAALRERIACFMAGEAVAFDESCLFLLALDGCSAFQRRVLIAEYGVPRGQVTTYGRLARQVNAPDGARAVGGALARNPFPIVIPCHRAVRSDGALGGYRGGLPMKRALLEMEGVPVSPARRVLADRFCY